MTRIFSLLTAIQGGDQAAVNVAFSNAMKEKVNVALDVRKVALTSSIYNEGAGDYEKNLKSIKSNKGYSDWEKKDYTKSLQVKTFGFAKGQKVTVEVPDGTSAWMTVQATITGFDTGPLGNNPKVLYKVKGGRQDTMALDIFKKRIKQ